MLTRPRQTYSHPDAEGPLVYISPVIMTDSVRIELHAAHNYARSTARSQQPQTSIQGDVQVKWLQRITSNRSAGPKYPCLTLGPND